MSQSCETFGPTSCEIGMNMDIQASTWFNHNDCSSHTDTDNLFVPVRLNYHHFSAREALHNDCHFIFFFFVLRRAMTWISNEQLLDILHVGFANGWLMMFTWPNHHIHKAYVKASIRFMHCIDVEFVLFLFQLASDTSPSHRRLTTPTHSA